MSTDRLVAIHQPNFFPWLGYFDKIRRADVFVVLDDVQFPKSGAGNWSNRVKLAIGGQPSWISMPVVSANRGLQRVCEVEAAESTQWRVKISKTIRMHYAKARHFSEVFPWLEPLIMNPAHALVDYNMEAINAICKALNIDPAKLQRSSSMTAQGQATDLIISLVRSAGGTAYLSGDGADGYQEEAKFTDAQLRLEMQGFHNPSYPQGLQGPFIPGLSSIDALMHCGFEDTARLLDRPDRAAL